MVKFKVLQTAAAALSLVAGLASAAVELPSLNIDKTQITVSGLSAGGFMANQMGIAHSSTFKGVGMFASGPYWCAGGVNYTSCMYNASITQSILTNAQAKIDSWSGSTIDAKSNIANQKIFIFVGSSDTTVGPNPVAALNTQYNNLGVPAANKKYVTQSGVAHVFPTDFDSTGNNSCSSAVSPFISNCGYDGAKAVLEHFYGTLNARNNAPAAGNYLEFNQATYTSSNPGMASTGWAYVPANCASGASCKLHVALHGCKQSSDLIGDKYVKNTGYTRWADTNSIVVLFPQAKVDNTSRQTAASSTLSNPNACWDWIGWYGNNFAQNTGTQVKAIKAMVDKVSGGSTGGGTDPEDPPTNLPAPTNVTASAATSSSMAIAWGSVSGAVSYNVYRNGSKVNANALTATSYTDTGLAAATSYAWTVRGVSSTGAEGTASTPVTASTLGSTATCYTASNYAHTTAGRAYAAWGLTYANGSNDSMGFWNTFTTTTLKKTGTNTYVVGTCP